MQLILKETSFQLMIVFAVIALGYLLGSIHIKGISLGTAAVFLSGLPFGHFGAEAPAAFLVLPPA